MPEREEMEKRGWTYHYGRVYVTDLETGETEEWETATRYFKIEGDAIIIYRPGTGARNILPLNRYKVRFEEGSSGGCHITKVVCYALGLPDNSHQLNEIRRFRDEFLNKEGYSLEVEEYYANSSYYAKKIEKIAASEPGIYKKLYKKYIEPAVREIEKNNFKEAYRILKDYLNFVKNM